MRSLKIASLSLLLLLPGTVSAGQIYGTIRDGANPLRSAKVEVACPDFRQGSIPITGQTDNLGSFRMNVAPRGRCLLRVGNAEATAIYSSDNAIRYDFDIVQSSSGRALRRH